MKERERERERERGREREREREVINIFKCCITELLFCTSLSRVPRARVVLFSSYR